MMKCIIIDDDIFIRESIKKLLYSIDNIQVIADFSEPLLAIKYMNENLIDFLILDIHMPNFNGFDFINNLKKSIPIILITSDKEFALKAFEYESIVDYLLKPIEIERLNKSIEKVKKFNSIFNESSSKDLKINKDNELYVNVGKKLIKLKFEDIFLIEANGDYIVIHSELKKYTVHSTLKKVEDKLSDSFFKVHRSFIVNLNNLIDIEDNTLLIKDKVIPISRLKKQELIERLNLL